MADETLRKVQEEIRAVLERHDVPGLVLLASKKQTDWMIKPDASWTCARTEHDAHGRTMLRLRSKLVDYESREAQKLVAEQTAGVLLGWLDAMRSMESTLREMIIATGWDIEHWSREEAEE